MKQIKLEYYNKKKELLVEEYEDEKDFLINHHCQESHLCEVKLFMYYGSEMRHYSQTGASITSRYVTQLKRVCDVWTFIVIRFREYFPVKKANVTTNVLDMFIDFMTKEKKESYENFIREGQYKKAESIIENEGQSNPEYRPNKIRGYSAVGSKKIEITWTDNNADHFTGEITQSILVKRISELMHQDNKTLDLEDLPLAWRDIVVAENHIDKKEKGYIEGQMSFKLLLA